ncbi:MAG: SIS domain-containing protein [Candidatus Sulfotelmatobacter sp.]
MTHFLQDILRQPDELQRTIEYLSLGGRGILEDAANALRGARHVYLTGIGSSWHAGRGAAAMFARNGRPVHLLEAAELLHFTVLPPDSVIVAISRTGRSIEIVQLLSKARESGSTVIGVTNSADGALALESQISLVVPVTFDHGISVNTYSTLACAAGALAAAVAHSFDSVLTTRICDAAKESTEAIPRWQEQIAHTRWLLPRAAYYFLGRGPSLGSCHEARLLWEEGVKSPATSMGTSSFRHGPQEIVDSGLRFGIWIDAQQMRDQDLAVARDLKRMGGSVMLIGQHLAPDAADLVFELPQIPEAWQFLIDIIPAQLCAEHLAKLSGADTDSFRYCSYIVEDEYGLLHDKVGARKDGN